ncbi:hypothetical protein OWR29_40850, partial [Actinoplanes sp. Pm04-4]
TLEKRPGSQINCQRNLPPNYSFRRTSKPAGVLLNWHWLIKHPVEFSKNNHTRLTAPGHFNYFTRRFPFRQIRVATRISPKPKGLGTTNSAGRIAGR